MTTIAKQKIHPSTFYGTSQSIKGINSNGSILVGFNTRQKGAWIKTIAKFLSPAALLTAPFLALANGVQDGLQTGALSSLFGTTGGSLSSSGSLKELIFYAINLMLMFAAAIAVVFVIIGGYYYITSGGNEEQSEKGKKTLINAVIGIIVIVLSYAIINVIVSLVSTENRF